MPPLLATRVGIVAKPSGDVLLVESLVMSPRVPRARSRIPLEPDTSMIEPASAAMFPLTVTVPPARIWPILRPKGSGTRSLVPAVDKTLPGNRSTVIYASLGVLFRDG